MGYDQHYFAFLYFFFDDLGERSCALLEVIMI